jgi:heme oxygenase
LHPLAVLYVLLGSGMGAEVLRRRWLAASDPVVRGAGHLFGLPPRTAGWRQFCAEMAGRPADGADAAEVLRDAVRIFGLYRTALDQARPPVRSRIET